MSKKTKTKTTTKTQNLVLTALLERITEYKIHTRDLIQECSKDAAQTQQQRPATPMVTLSLIGHACKYKENKPHQSGTSSDYLAYVPCIYSHAT